MSKRKYKPLPPTEQQIEKGCTSKQIYYSESQAHAVALTIRSTRGVNVYPYACKYCENWHIGHRYN
jgi:uncharacterized membrane protein YgcG